MQNSYSMLQGKGRGLLAEANPWMFSTAQNGAQLGTKPRLYSRQTGASSTRRWLKEGRKEGELFPGG